ncbi:hypothetical protein [Mycolicibacterium sphagni]|uniref:hypothetical protein n=1 Tax=Mycolicibacterium sphagni TaxID=1786 RepID=UPI0021F2511E|nr:hypothetical protein [Mycolicibacterium sphagni]MCV7174825.1 hypothetical protein [Mycolicibacterium sphagni]
MTELRNAALAAIGLGYVVHWWLGVLFTLSVLAVMAGFAVLPYSRPNAGVAKTPQQANQAKQPSVSGPVRQPVTVAAPVRRFNTITGEAPLEFVTGRMGTRRPVPVSNGDAL